MSDDLYITLSEPRHSTTNGSVHREQMLRYLFESVDLISSYGSKEKEIQYELLPSFHQETLPHTSRGILLTSRDVKPFVQAADSCYGERSPRVPRLRVSRHGP